MANSILKTEKGVCFICTKHGGTHLHHIFGAANRKRADRDGLTVYLCPPCHERVHGDYTYNVGLKRIGQVAYCEYYEKTTEDFIREYGKNYIWEVDE